MPYDKRHMLLSVSILTVAAAMTVSSVAVAATGCVTKTKKCVVEISVTGNPASYKVTFDPDVLHVKESEINKKYKIFLHLFSNDYKFEKPKKDGVFFKVSVNNEFACDVSTLSSKQWVCQYKNSVPGRYSYKAIFHDTAGNVYVGDPVITNIDSH